MSRGADLRSLLFVLKSAGARSLRSAFVKNRGFRPRFRAARGLAFLYALRVPTSTRACPVILKPGAALRCIPVGGSSANLLSHENFRASGPFHVPASGTFFLPASGTFFLPASGTFLLPASGTFLLPASGRTYRLLPEPLCKNLNNPLTPIKFHDIPYLPVRTG